MVLRQSSKHKMYFSVYFWIMALLSPIQSALSCGETLIARKGEIKTPNYPKNYDDNLNCTWVIHVNEQDTITVEFLFFEVESSILIVVDCADHFYIYDGPDSSSALLFGGCGDELPKPVFSSGNTLTVSFLTDHRTTKGGVHLSWKQSDKFTINVQPATWFEANDVCMNDGGHLATQNDLTDPHLVTSMENVSDRLWFGEYFTPWVWLKGCYKDKDRNLTSIKPFQQSKENQAKVCQYLCNDSVYFGLQDLNCFCLTTEDLDKLEFVRSLYECAITCRGNRNEMCGGAYSFTVYMNDVCWNKSSIWTAKISRTISGRTCQSWSVDYPHSHHFHEDSMFPDGSEDAASNYCRDPDGKGAPWCFTTDEEVPWQFCDAPPCAGTCWMDPTEYSGYLNISMYGHSCVDWIDAPAQYHDPSKYPDQSVEDASNYCRSPDGYPALWCFDSESQRGYCGSPPCFDETQSKETGELCRSYTATSSRFFYQEHDCDDWELFACFVNGSQQALKLKSVVVSGFEQDFDKARTLCRRNYYSLSDYKVLFGLLQNYNSEFWLGNFRAFDNTQNKDKVPTTSACKTMERQGDELLTKFQPDCNLQLGFICKKEAVLCGENYTTDEGNITWPGDPGEYVNDEYCEWEINVSDGRSINVVFLDIDIEYSEECSFDFVEISDTSTNVPKTVERFCGEKANITITSSSNKVMIKFKSDKDTGGSGFRLEWSSEAIPTTTMASSKTSVTFNPDKSSSFPNSGRFVDTDDSDNSSLEGGAIAGIVVGGLLIIVVAIVLTLLLRRRMMNQEAREIQPDIHYNKEDSISVTSHKDVYSTPIPKKLRNLQEQSSGAKSSPEPDNNYYHHLHQAPSSSGSANLPISTNTYEKLQTGDMYDHTTDAEANTIGEAYAHLDNAINQSELKSIDYEYIVQEINNPAVCGSKADNQYITPSGLNPSKSRVYDNTATGDKSGAESMDEYVLMDDNAINNPTEIDAETYYNASDSNDVVHTAELDKLAIADAQKGLVYDNI